MSSSSSSSNKGGKPTPKSGQKPIGAVEDDPSSSALSSEDEVEPPRGRHHQAEAPAKDDVSSSANADEAAGYVGGKGVPVATNKRELISFYKEDQPVEAMEKVKVGSNTLVGPGVKTAAATTTPDAVKVETGTETEAAPAKRSVGSGTIVRGSVGRGRTLRRGLPGVVYTHNYVQHKHKPASADVATDMAKMSLQQQNNKQEEEKKVEEEVKQDGKEEESKAKKNGDGKKNEDSSSSSN